jgi:large subunit ribosomal protein L21
MLYQISNSLEMRPVKIYLDKTDKKPDYPAFQESKYCYCGGILMYAVVATGGKQYKVQEGEVLRVEKLTGEVGSEVAFDQVLMLSDGENVKVGQPVLEGVQVKGHIVEQGKHRKIIVFKYKRRKRYRRKQGHRQLFTAVKIDAIEA